jgi:hypothetical protein
MEYEIITVNHYYANNFSGKKQAKLYENGDLEYLPFIEPEVEEAASLEAKE